MHAARKYDDKGEPVIDERGRPVYRMRKHDIEEFADVVARYGCYKADLESFAAALRRGALKDPFEPCEECKEQPGWIQVTDENGTKRAKRCRCWMAWNERRSDAKAESSVRTA